MNTTLNTQIPLIFSGIRLALAYLGLAFAISVHSFSPEAEMVLEALREKMAAGVLGSDTYMAFLSQLDESDECKTWMRNSGEYRLMSEIWNVITALCLEEQPARPSPSWHSQASVEQSFQPRSHAHSLPLLEGEMTSSFGRASLRLKQNQIYDRRLELFHKGLHFFAGHISPSLSPTRLEFISGRPFYRGLTGRSGFSGDLASSKSALEGMGLGFRGQDWQVQTAGTWNQWAPGHDARLFHLGLKWQNLRLQALQNHFETNQGPLADAWIGGAEFFHPNKTWEVGMGISRWTWEKDSGPEKSKAGSYGQISLGLPGSYRLELRQASPSWFNLLQGQGGISGGISGGVSSGISRGSSTGMDSVSEPWVLPGKGDGHLNLQGQFLIGSHRQYKAELKNGIQLTWDLKTLDESGLLTADPRLALIQTLGHWTYTFGTGMHFKRAENESERQGQGDDPQHLQQETSVSGFGHILTWGNQRWKAKLSLKQQSAFYQGPFPEPVAFALERSGKDLNHGLFRMEMMTADWRQPAHYLRVILKQEWRLSGDLRFQNWLKLPWTRSHGWSSELGYQLGLVASL